MTKNGLIISGSDVFSAGGMQADLATFNRHGVQGFTALTSQVYLKDKALVISPTTLADFTSSLANFAEVDWSVIKIGLLPSLSHIAALADFLTSQKSVPIVLDPVLVFKENRDDEVHQFGSALSKQLFARASVITPNLREAELLTGLSIRGEAELEQASQVLLNQGAQAVVIKGGSRLTSKGQALDSLHDGQKFYQFTKPRLKDVVVTGAGCTFASSLAANLAQGRDLVSATEAAKHYTHQAIIAHNQYGVTQLHDA